MPLTTFWSEISARTVDSSVCPDSYHRLLELSRDSSSHQGCYSYGNRFPIESAQLERAI